MEYQIGDTVLYRQARCACVGGGFTEQYGTIVGTIPHPKQQWYHIDSPTGIVSVSSTNILRRQ